VVLAYEVLRVCRRSPSFGSRYRGSVVKTGGIARARATRRRITTCFKLTRRAKMRFRAFRPRSPRNLSVVAQRAGPTPGTARSPRISCVVLKFFGAEVAGEKCSMSDWVAGVLSFAASRCDPRRVLERPHSHQRFFGLLPGIDSGFGREPLCRSPWTF